MGTTKADWSWSVDVAGRLPIPAGRQSSLVFKDDHVEIRFYAPKVRDDQQPHERDEIYIVASGSASFTRDGERRSVAPGDVIQVPARTEHRFSDLSDDFATWVVFYG